MESGSLLSSQNGNMVYCVLSSMGSESFIKYKYMFSCKDHGQAFYRAEGYRIEGLENIHFLTVCPCFLLAYEKADFLEKPICSWPSGHSLLEQLHESGPARGILRVEMLVANSVFGDRAGGEELVRLICRLSF